MRKIIFLIMTLTLCGLAQGAMTNSASNIISPDYVNYIGSMNDTLDPVYLFCNEAETALEAYGLEGAGDITMPASTKMIFPEISAPAGNPTANTGWLYVKDNAATSALYFEDDAGSVTLLAAGSGDNTLDDAYDQGGAGAGRTIDVDTGAVALTVSDTDNNAALVVTQNDATNDPDAVQIVMGAGSTGSALLINSVASGTDITGDNWSVSQAGVITAVSVDLSTSIILANDETITNATNTEIAFTDSGSSEDFILDLDSGTNTIGFKSSTGVVAIDFGDVDALSGINAITLDAASSAITLPTDGDADDLLLQTTGATDSTITIQSTGTGADAIVLNATAGGIDLTANGAAAGEDIDIQTNASVNITSTEASADAIVISASTAVGGIDITSNADIDITTTGAAGEDISITNTGGSIAISATENDQGAIDIQANGGTSERVRIYSNQGTGASATTQSDASVQLLSDDGGISLYTTGNVADAVRIETNGGASETIWINNLQGTGADAVNIRANAAGGDVNIDSILGRIEIEAEEDVANALYLIADGGTSTTLQVFNDTGTSVTEKACAVQLLSDVGGIGLVSNANLAKSIQIVADGGATESIYIQADQGTAASAATETDAAIQLVADAGGIGLYSGLNAVDSVRIEANGGASETITIRSIQGTSVTEDAAALQLWAVAGGIQIQSDANLDDALVLRVDGGTTSEMTLHNDQGTAADSIELVSDAGGITISTGTYTTIDGIAQTPIVVTDAASYAVLAANSGIVHIITDLSQNTEIQMPTEAAGLYYKFIYCGATETHTHTIDTENNTNYFVGGLVHLDTDSGAGGDEVVVVTSDGNSNSEIDIVTPENGTVIEMFCQDGTHWYITGQVVSATVPALTDQ